LTAALRAYSHRLRALVIEKEPKVGGSTAYSGRGLWLPNNPVMKAHGVPDSLESALTYMNAIIGDVGSASTQERRRAFLDNGPKMAGFLQGLGFKWQHTARYPDYH
jgi:3-oxosteroid 1-dehydrogenase